MTAPFAASTTPSISDVGLCVVQLAVKCVSRYWCAPQLPHPVRGLPFTSFPAVMLSNLAFDQLMRMTRRHLHEC